MKIINIYDRKSYLVRGLALNMRQLLNPIFFSVDRRHPDMKRQRCARQRAKDMAVARTLKAQYVPLCRVALPDPPEVFDMHTGAWRGITGRWPSSGEPPAWDYGHTGWRRVGGAA